MFGECHAHMIMDGANYKKAIELHKNGVQESVIRERFKRYQKQNIKFIRDGGDNLGVSAKAKELAQEYDIDYRTPIFAIHKKGCYGSIVGKSFSNLKEFHQRVLEAKSFGADFIKIMTTGLLDFNNHGEITGEPLDKKEVSQMVLIAHEEGMAVMSHTNGDYGVCAAVEAGVDSLEHGNYMGEETLRFLAESDTVWVPTLVPIRNLKGCGRFEDAILDPIIKRAEDNLRLSYDLKVKVALGSDGGAYQVSHVEGIYQEKNAFADILGDIPEVWNWLSEGENIIQRTFQRR